MHNTGNLETNGTKISGNLTNDGMMTGNILMYQFVQFSGTGTWDESGANRYFANPTLLVNGPQHTILGSGPINSPTLQNKGTIIAKASSGFSFSGPMLQNSGLIETPVGTTFSATATFDNEGTLRSGGVTTVWASDGFTNHASGVVDITGTLSLAQSTTLRNRSGGLVKGSGTLNRSVADATTLVNEGMVAPGDGIKTLSIGGDFQQLSTGHLKMDIDTGEALSSDLLAIDGAAALSGALEVALAPGDIVALGNSFTLLTATQGLTGVFDQLTLPNLSNGLFWNVQYSSNDVRITARELIPGDYSHDAIVDGADYAIWRKSLGSTTMLAADGDGNNVVDNQDYEIWRAHYGQIAAADSSSIAATVPEPTSAILILISMLTNRCCRRAAFLRMRSLSRPWVS